MENLVEFRAFSKIPRLFRDIRIYEKIDGTNATVGIFANADEFTVMAGQRNMWVRWPNGPDNYGFGAWVKAHEEELKQLGPGFHRGEWYGAGIQRGYGLKEKRFALFEPPKDGVVPAICQVVPLLFQGPFTTTWVHAALERLRSDGSALVPGYMKPEGIVVYHEASGQRFKATLDNDEKPKGVPNA